MCYISLGTLYEGAVFPKFVVGWHTPTTPTEWSFVGDVVEKAVWRTQESTEWGCSYSVMVLAGVFLGGG